MFPARARLLLLCIASTNMTLDGVNGSHKHPVALELENLRNFISKLQVGQFFMIKVLDTVDWEAYCRVLCRIQRYSLDAKIRKPTELKNAH